MLPTSGEPLDGTGKADAALDTEKDKQTIIPTLTYGIYLRRIDSS
jgi:hypothetical protein